MSYANILLSAVSLGLVYAPMALGVYIAVTILHTPDLTIDGSFIFGMVVCAYVTVAGHPILAMFAGMAAGAIAGLITGLMQTKLKIDAILSGILTLTGLYTINYMVLGGQANMYLQKMVTNDRGFQAPVASQTIFKLFPISGDNGSLILTAVIVILVLVILAVFFKTRTGMAIRATGDNEEMVLSSSINADSSRLIALMLSNALVGLSGSLLCHSQRYADLGLGNGILVVGLASVIIGQTFFGKRSVTLGLIASVVGSIAYRIVLQLSYQINMPSYAVKLLSAIIVVIALSVPFVRKRMKEATIRRKGREGAAS